MTLISVALKILIALVVIAFVLLFFFQSKLLFHPVKLEKGFIFNFTLPYEEKFFTYGNKSIHGLFFKAANPKVRIIFFHGNMGALDTWGNVGVDLNQRLNADVLVLDYPGFGKSEGDVPTSEIAMYESAEAAFDNFIASSDNNTPVILFGRSLGSAVASHLAAKKKVHALILETPYTSMKAMAKVVLPFVPGFMVRYNLDNESNIEKLNMPILILHGTADRVIPYTQGKQLAAKNTLTELITIEGGDHNDLSAFAIYWQAIEKFVGRQK